MHNRLEAQVERGGFTVPTCNLQLRLDEFNIALGGQEAGLG